MRPIVAIVTCICVCACAACALPDAAEPPVSRAAAIADGAEVAIYRVTDGDSISGIADRLSFPGGWRALARLNGLRASHDYLIRTTAGLRVPVDYLRAAGLDPYTQLGLEPFDPPLASQPLVPCETVASSGACAELGDQLVCIEPTDPERVVDLTGVVAADVFAADGAFDRDEPDGAEHRATHAGRALVLYRGDDRRVIAALPTRGDIRIDARRVDLDGDGRDELVVAVPIEIRNHQGFEYARLFVIDARGGATQLDVAQWGEGGLVVGANGTCDVLATSWTDERHPLQGDGVYYEGRPFAFDGHALLPRGPVVMRRFRDRFFWDQDAVEAWRARRDLVASDPFPEVPMTPAAWLSVPDAGWWHELGARVLDTRRGRIADVEPIEGGVALDVAFDNGDRVHFDPRTSPFPEDEPRVGESLRAVGWAPTGGRFPDAFVPADPTAWRGMDALIERVGVATDDEDSQDVSYEIWLAPS